MSKGVFIASIEPRSGKSIVVLGLMNAVVNHRGCVGYFKPVMSLFGRLPHAGDEGQAPARLLITPPHNGAIGLSMP